MGILGRPSLIKTGIQEGFRNKKLFEGLYYISHKTGLPTIADSAAPEVIERLEGELAKDPRDWLVLYYLGDWYSREKRYVDALRALEKAYEIRPKDPRSAFALATTYRILTRARYVGMEPEDIFPDGLPESFTQDNSFDPIASARELEKLGLSIDEAAEKATEYFEKTLSIGVRKDEKRFVTESIEKMYADFPHLELKVKNKRELTSGLFQEARKDSGGILNEAVSHYTRLRFLMDDLPRYRYELGEVIRLCQWSIAADNRQGDAYVLLANAYSLLDSNVSNSSLDRFYYMRWAASIIQHWSDSPLRNYPFSKNIEIGNRLYENLLDEVVRELECPREQAISQMKEWSKEYLLEALNPASFGKIKEQLEYQHST